MENEKITSAQFYIMMFVSRVVVTIGLNARFLGGENMLEAIVSYAAAMLLGLLIAWPIRLLQKRSPGLPVGEAARQVMGKWGAAVSLFYILYFIVTNAASLGLFHVYLLDNVNPEFSSALIVAAMLAAAVYGAWRGIETVARCAACVFAILLVGTGLVFVIVAFRFEPENLEPLFANGFDQTLRGTALFLSRTSLFADMAVLLPMVKDRSKAGFLSWIGGTTLFIAVLLLLLAGCLGPYAATQDFPVFALASVTEVRSLQRLDAVFVGVWMMGLVVRLACELYACRVCCASLSEKRRPGLSAALCGAATLALAYAMSGVEAVRRILLNTRLLLPCTVLTGAVLPLLVILIQKCQAKKGGKKRESV